MVTLSPDYRSEERKITTSDVRQQLAAHLTRLWRYGLVLVVEELVQSACVRALEKSARFTPRRRPTRCPSRLVTLSWFYLQLTGPGQ